MVKYQKILKTVLLMSVVGGFMPEALGSGFSDSYELAVDPRRAALLSNPTKTRGSDHRHQVRSLELQEKIRSVERSAFGAEAQADTAVEYQRIFCELVYAKFKTAYDLRHEQGGKPLNTTSSVFLEELDGKYEGFSAYEHGATISPFKEMVGLLHEMGIRKDFLCGLVTTDPDELNPQFFLHKLMASLEVPDPSFVAEDLPVPHYEKVGKTGSYTPSTTTPKKYLHAYLGMLDHLSYNFKKRLRVDVAMLRDMLVEGHAINADRKLGLVEDPIPMFLKPGSEVWVKKDAVSLLGIWRPEEEEEETGRGQEAFARILRLYLRDFALPAPLLDAAIPPNSLGMAYRLLQAAESDIHSWALPFELKGNAGIPDGLSHSTKEFLGKVQDIVGRHFNLRVLQIMSDNVRVLISERLKAVAPQESPLEAREREAAEREAQRIAAEQFEAQRAAEELEAQRIAAEEEAQRRATDPEALVEVEPGRFVKRKDLLPGGGYRGGFSF